MKQKYWYNNKGRRKENEGRSPGAAVKVAPNKLWNNV
jgi:hypothetical protein